MDAAADVTPSYATRRVLRKLPARIMVLVPLGGFIVSALLAQAAPMLEFFYVFVIALAVIVPLILLLGAMVAFIVAFLTRRLVRTTLTMILFWLAALGGVGFSTWTFYAQQPGNERRAEIIARAIERYRADTGNYPATLDDLKPRYLAHLPACWYGLYPYHFAYVPGQFLKFMEIPGQCGRFYDFSTRTWHSECS